MPERRHRAWIFTLNNPTAWDTADLEKLIEESTYVCKGNEVGENGTPHWQGFVYSKNKKSFQQMRTALPRAHWQPKSKHSTFDQAIDYTKKDGDWTQWGDRPSGPQGQGNKWKAVLAYARAGDIQKIEDEYPDIFFRYHAKLLSLFKPERPLILDTLENEWWYGETGTGKSKELWRLYPNHYIKSLNKWWDGYQNEEIVAIEEWSPKNEVTASFLKIWSDRYPFSAEIKGGTLQKIRPKKIIILSNYKLEECFSNESDLLPLKRRFQIKHFIAL